MSADPLKLREALEAALLPCPFDNGQGLHGSKVRNNGRDGCGPADTWWVQCKCGAEGPNARGPDEAVDLWNRRALLAQGRDEVVEMAIEKIGDLASAALENGDAGKGDFWYHRLHGIEDCKRAVRSLKSSSVAGEGEDPPS